MAAVSSVFSHVTLGPPVLCPSAGTQKSSVGRFDALRACSGVRQSATVLRLVGPRRFTISAVADESTLTTVQSIIAKQLVCNTTKVLPESKFSDLGADSLDTVEIMMSLEETFEVSLDEEAAEKVTTVQEAADLIHAFVQQKT